jgi:hypothetical protein
MFDSNVFLQVPAAVELHVTYVTTKHLPVMDTHVSLEVVHVCAGVATDTASVLSSKAGQAGSCRGYRTRGPQGHPTHHHVYRPAVGTCKNQTSALVLAPP